MDLFYENGTFGVWNEDTIYWRFDCDFPEQDMEDAREGFYYWEEEASREMFVQLTCDDDLAQITVGWTVDRYRPGDECKAGVLGTAQRRLEIPWIVEARIMYYEPWFSSGQLQKRLTSRHEVGHSLGMRHMDDERCIMYPSVGRFDLKNACSEEIVQFYEVYGWRQ